MMQAFALPARAGIRSRLSAVAVYLSCPEGKPESRNPPGALSKKGGEQLRRQLRIESVRTRV